MKLSQTVSGDWVITVPNPEERHWETELARFEASVAGEGSPAREAIEASAAYTAANIHSSLKSPKADINVTSHDPQAAKRMKERVDYHMAIRSSYAKCA